jgi:glycosyltransferase involved in cell wall biosynthesis
LKLIIEAIHYREDAGMAKHLRELLRNWVIDSRICIQLYLPHSKKEFYSLPSYQNITIKGIRWIEYSPLFGIIWKLLFLPVIARLSGAKMLFLPFNPLVLTKRWYGIATTVVIRDLAECVIPNKYDSFRMFYRTKIMLPTTLINATKVIFISSSTYADAKRFMKFEKTNYRIIHHGRSTEFFDHKKKSNPSFVKTTGKNYFLTVGRLDPVGKNLIRALRAFELFTNNNAESDFQYVLVGADWRNSAVLYSYLESYKYRKRVKLLGYITKNQLIELYSHATTFVFPSLYEGFGHPIIESMSCGCPVICSNTSSLPEIAGDAAIFFNPYKELEIFKAMQDSILDENLRREMIDRGYRNIDRFSWESTSTKTINYILED